MPFTAEEAKLVGEALANALAPKFDAVTTGLADLKTAQEAKQVTKTPLSFGDVSARISTAKLSEEASKRVFEAIDKADIADDEFVTGVIAQETARVADANAAIKAHLQAANIAFDESEGVITVKGASSVAQESKPVEAGGVKGWGVTAK